MKAAMKMLIVGVLIVNSLSVIAGGIVKIGEWNQREASTIPILLECDEDLSFLSMTLSYDDTANFNQPSVEITESRFPWDNRGIVTSVNAEKGEYIFTVADLNGRNTMVSAGDGVLFTIAGQASTDFEATTSVEITKIEAFNQAGKKVEIEVQ